MNSKEELDQIASDLKTKNSIDLKIKEYELLQNLELETNRIRHTTFTALLSISFLIPSLSTKIDQSTTLLSYFAIPLNKIVFLFGFIFYAFSVFHYWWYHRYSHKYRGRLKVLENELGFTIYKNRVRPIKFRKFKMHFDWSLYIIGLFYGLVTAEYVGWQLFSITFLSMISIYIILMLTSYKQKPEPNE